MVYDTSGRTCCLVETPDVCGLQPAPSANHVRRLASEVSRHVHDDVGQRGEQAILTHMKTYTEY